MVPITGEWKQEEERVDRKKVCYTHTHTDTPTHPHGHYDHAPLKLYSSLAHKSFFLRNSEWPTTWGGL